MTRRTLLILSALAIPASSIFGQAIVLDRGQSSFGVGYQHTFVRYHVGFDGKKVDLGHIMSYAVQPVASYGVTDRLSIDADLSFAAGKYIGTLPHGRIDDGTFHSTLQDFHIGARMSLLTQPLFATPFIRLSIPSHHYQLEGHTATGKGKVELTSGIYFGRDLGPFLSNGFFEAMASHTFTQRTVIQSDSERLNRTNGSLEVGYYLTRSLTLSAYGTGIRTHGGWTLPRPFLDEEQILEHDRFDKTKMIQVAGRISYDFAHGIAAYAGYITTVWARTAHELRGPTVGLTWSPRPAQQWLARARTRQPIQLAQR